MQASERGLLHLQQSTSKFKPLHSVSVISDATENQAMQIKKKARNQEM